MKAEFICIAYVRCLLDEVKITKIVYSVLNWNRCMTCSDETKSTNGSICMTCSDQSRIEMENKWICLHQVLGSNSDENEECMYQSIDYSGLSTFLHSFFKQRHGIYRPLLSSAFIFLGVTPFRYPQSHSISVPAGMSTSACK